MKAGNVHSAGIALGTVALVLLGALVAACAAQPAPSRSKESRILSMSDLQLLTRGGCSNTTTLRANLDVALKAMGLTEDYLVVDLDTLRKDDARRGYPTPTLLLAGRDLFGMEHPEPPDPDPT